MSVSSAILGDIATVFNGKTPAKSEQRDSGHPVLKIKDMDASGSFRGKFESHVDLAFAEKHAAKAVKLYDTLILNAAHNADYVGSKQCRAAEDIVGSIATGEWLIVRSNSENLDSRYLNHWLSSPETKFRMKSLVKGIHLYPKDVARLKIPIPPRRTKAHCRHPRQSGCHSPKTPTSHRAFRTIPALCIF